MYTKRAAFLLDRIVVQPKKKKCLYDLHHEAHLGRERGVGRRARRDRFGEPFQDLLNECD